MNNEQKITPHITIAGQPSAEELKSLGVAGYRTLVNLRPEGEEGSLPDEKSIVSSTGLTYVAVPVTPDLLDDMAVERFSQEISADDAAPVLVHCKSGGRAGLLVLMHLAITNGWTVEEALEQGREHGNIAPSELSPYRAFFEDFIRRHSAGER